MIIRSLQIRNFGPYGNIPQKLTFSTDSELNYIFARNGSGKTTLINAINYGLYGRVPDIPLKELPNRVNKNHMVVKINLLTKLGEINICRGKNPNVLTVHINGDEYDVAGKKNVQSFLEEEVYGIPYTVFTNLINLSIKTFKSFITMTPRDKREIIDLMFGFVFINKVLVKCKENVNTIKKNIDKLNVECETRQKNINTLNKKIQTINESENNVNKLNKLNDELRNLNDEKTKLGKKVRIIEDKKNEIVSSVSREKSTLRNYNKEKETVIKKYNIFNSGVCPTCNTKLDSSEHKKILTKLKCEGKKIKENINIQKKNLERLVQKLNQGNKLQLKLHAQLEKLQSNINCKQSKKTSIQGNVNAITSKFKDLLSTYKKSLKDATKKLVAESHNLEVFDIMLNVLDGEDGVKKKMISEIIPVINQLMQKYADEFNFPMHMEFTNNFDVIVKDRGVEINVKTLSAGESTIANKIVIFSFLEVLLLQHPQLNLLFLDEIFSSLDINNIRNALKILKNLVTKFNMNIYIVAHADIQPQLFNKVIRIEKDCGFSEIHVEKQ